MKKNTFKVLFYIRGNRINKDGNVSVMIRITVDGEMEQLNSKLVVNPEIWDAKTGRAIGRSAKVLELNSRLNDIQVILKEHYYDIQRRHGYVTAEMVRNAYMGITQREESLLKLYEQHLEDTKKLVGLSKADPTYRKYERMYRRVVEFMKKKYNITDIPLREIRYQFIVDLEFFLRTEYKYSQNTTYKCMKFFKQVINKAIRAGLITVDPFNGYKISIERVDRGFLSEDDLTKMMSKTFASKRLEQVRDIFIFACFTGLAYIDLANLRVDNIQKMFDGRLWIVTHRQKTNTKVTVPLLPPAIKILKKYEGEFVDGKILPIITNQKMNCYLKEIAEICGIEKNLTFHLARHTFATTMTLGKGVPIETVSKMLGHTNVQTTQIYARITNDKISKDMNWLLEKARAFDPFGHAGLTPLGEIRLTLAGEIKMTPVEASAGEFFVALRLLVLARRGSISKTTEYDCKIKKHPSMLRSRNGNKRDGQHVSPFPQHRTQVCPAVHFKRQDYRTAA